MIKILNSFLWKVWTLRLSISNTNFILYTSDDICQFLIIILYVKQKYLRHISKHKSSKLIKLFIKKNEQKYFPELIFSSSSFSLLLPLKNFIFFYLSTIFNNIFAHFNAFNNFLCNGKFCCVVLIFKFKKKFSNIKQSILYRKKKRLVKAL